MLGLFSLKVAGVSGGVLYMVNHGLSTGALFLVVGCMYERYHTRDIDEVGGLARQMPWLAFFLVFFTLSSVGLPGLNGFVGEFLVLLGTATSTTIEDGFAPGPLGYGYVIPAATGIILSAVYMLWMCQRVLFGPLKEPPNTPDASTGLTKDLTRREITVLAPIALACVIIGVYPRPMLGEFEVAIRQNILGSHAAIARAGEEFTPAADEHELSPIGVRPEVDHRIEQVSAGALARDVVDRPVSLPTREVSGLRRLTPEVACAVPARMRWLRSLWDCGSGRCTAHGRLLQAVWREAMRRLPNER
jgi:NADH-quinone oxidoreductase subunit M